MISAESLTRPSKEEKNTSAAKEWFSSLLLTGQIFQHAVSQLLNRKYNA